MELRYIEEIRKQYYAAVVEGPAVVIPRARLPRLKGGPPSSSIATSVDVAISAAVTPIEKCTKILAKLAFCDQYHGWLQTLWRASLRITPA